MCAVSARRVGGGGSSRRRRLDHPGIPVARAAFSLSLSFSPIIDSLAMARADNGAAESLLLPDQMSIDGTRRERRRHRERETERVKNMKYVILYYCILFTGSCDAVVDVNVSGDDERTTIGRRDKSSPSGIAENVRDVT